MTTLQDIYTDFRTNYSDSPGYASDFFSRHAIYLDNKSSFKDKDSLELFIELTWQQINDLYLKAYYNSVLDVADKRLSLIETEISRFDSSLENDWYFGIIFFKGMALYNLKSYRKSTTIFKMLSDKDPDNDQYKKWLRYSRAGQGRIFINIGWLICLAVLMADIFFKPIFNSSWWLPISLLTFVSMVTLGLYEYFLNRSLRRDRMTAK